MTDAASIAARFQISDVIYAYARAIRRRRAEDAAALFTADATFETRAGWTGSNGELVSRYEGRDAIRDFLAGGMARVHLCPAVHNLIVETDGETARSDCLLISHILGTGTSIFGEYEDHLRFDGRWLFTSRQVRMLIDPAK